MFIDYYAVLQIDEKATLSEIKAAFRKQAIKWHPDRNLGKDTTLKMQRINEAYLIIKDSEARQKFDIEYQKFKVYQEKQHQQKRCQKQSNTYQENNDKQQEIKTEYIDYTFFDETLKNWINNARKQSVDLAKQTIIDFKGMVAVGFKEGMKASGGALLGQIVVSIIILIVFGIIKSCNA